MIRLQSEMTARVIALMTMGLRYGQAVNGSWYVGTQEELFAMDIAKPIDAKAGDSAANNPAPVDPDR